MAYPRFQRARAFKYARRTSGVVSVTSSSAYQDVDTGLDITLNCQVGDVLEAVVSALGDTGGGASEICMEAVTIVSATPTNAFSTGAAPAATNSGVLGWMMTRSQYSGVGGSAFYTVQSADIVSGLVTVRLRARLLTGTTARNIICDANDPLMFGVKNLGPVDPS